MVSGFGCFFEGILTLPNFIKNHHRRKLQVHTVACDMTAIVTEHHKTSVSGGNDGANFTVCI